MDGSKIACNTKEEVGVTKWDTIGFKVTTKWRVKKDVQRHHGKDNKCM